MVFVVLFVPNLEISKGHVADGHIKEAVRYLDLFKPIHSDTAVLIELLGNTPGDGVDLHAVDFAACRALREHTDKVTNAAAWFQKVTLTESHLLQRLIHGSDNDRRSIKGGQRAGTGSGIFVLVKQGFQFQIFAVTLVKAVGQTAPAYIPGQNFLFFGSGKPFFRFNAFQAADGGHVGGVFLTGGAVTQLVIRDAKVPARICRDFRVQGGEHHTLPFGFWRCKGYWFLFVRLFCNFSHIAICIHNLRRIFGALTVDLLIPFICLGHHNIKVQIGKVHVQIRQTFAGIFIDGFAVHPIHQTVGGQIRENLHRMLAVGGGTVRKIYMGEIGIICALVKDILTVFVNELSCFFQFCGKIGLFWFFAQQLSLDIIRRVLCVALAAAGGVLGKANIQQLVRHFVTVLLQIPGDLIPANLLGGLFFRQIPEAFHTKLQVNGDFFLRVGIVQIGLERCQNTGSLIRLMELTSQLFQCDGIRFTQLQIVPVVIGVKLLIEMQQLCRKIPVRVVCRRCDDRLQLFSFPEQGEGAVSERRQVFKATLARAVRPILLCRGFPDRHHHLIDRFHLFWVIQLWLDHLNRVIEVKAVRIRMGLILGYTVKEMINVPCKLSFFIGRDIRQLLLRHITVCTNQLGYPLFHLRPRQKDLIIGLKQVILAGVRNAFTVVVLVKAHPAMAADAVFVFQEVHPFLLTVVLQEIGVYTEFAVLDIAASDQQLVNLIFRNKLLWGCVHRSRSRERNRFTQQPLQALQQFAGTVIVKPEQFSVFGKCRAEGGQFHDDILDGCAICQHPGKPGVHIRIACACIMHCLYRWHISGFTGFFRKITYKMQKAFRQCFFLHAVGSVHNRLWHIAPQFQQFPDALGCVFPGEDGRMVYGRGSAIGDAQTVFIEPDRIGAGAKEKAFAVPAIFLLQKSGVLFQRVVLGEIRIDTLQTVRLIAAETQCRIYDLLGKRWSCKDGHLRCFIRRWSVERRQVKETHLLAVHIFRRRDLRIDEVFFFLNKLSCPSGNHRP